MERESQAACFDLARYKRFQTALRAFERGDVDQAQRILKASFHHHTRPALSGTDQLALWWCHAWFAYYERRFQRGEKIVRLIIALEETIKSRRTERIIHAKFVLAMFCSGHGNTVGAETTSRSEALALVESASFQSKKRDVISSRLKSDAS